MIRMSVLLQFEKRNVTRGSDNSCRALSLFYTLLMSVFKATVFLLETETTTSCDLYEIMKKCRDCLQSNISDEFVGMKVKLALRKQYLSDTVIRKF